MAERHIYTTDPRMRIDPRAVAADRRAKHAETVAAIRDALGAKVSPEASDFLAGMQTLLLADGVANQTAGHLLESNVLAAKMRRQQAEAEAKPAKAKAAA